MRSLYESILYGDTKITNDIVPNAVKSLIMNPQEDNTVVLNKLWKKLGLSFNVGLGEGEWVWHPISKTFCYLVNVKTYVTVTGDRRIQNIVVAQCRYNGKLIKSNDHAILIYKEDWEKNKVIEWAKKVAEVLKMKLTNRVDIFLDFLP